MSGTLLFASHGVSFAVNFLGGREFAEREWETQVGKPLLRAMPMWMAALVGGFIGGFFTSAAWMLVFVLPVKLTLNVFGHFADHDKLKFDEVPDPFENPAFKP